MGRNLKHPETKAIRQNCDAFDNKIKVFCPMKNIMSDNRKYLQCLRDKELVSKYRVTLVKINLIGKWSKNMVRLFTEGDTLKASKPINRCSSLFLIREIQLK